MLCVEMRVRTGGCGAAMRRVWRWVRDLVWRMSGWVVSLIGEDVGVVYGCCWAVLLMLNRGGE